VVDLEIKAPERRKIRQLEKKLELSIRRVYYKKRFKLRLKGLRGILRRLLD